MDVPHDDEKKPEETTVELGTTEIHIDEHGNLQTATDQAAAVPAPTPPQPAPEPISPLPTTPLETTLPPLPTPPELTLPPLAPAPPPLGIETPELPPLPPLPPLPSLTPTADEPHHELMSSTPFSTPAPNPTQEDQPNWSTPYNLSPMDPFNGGPQDPGEMHEPKDLVFQGKNVTPPPDMTAGNLGQARDAVASALTSAPFDPLTAGPIQALNAQPMDQQPLHTDITPSITPLPAQPGATPSLVLPTAPNQPVATTPVEMHTPPPLPPPDMAAPPPVPPPLVAAPGVVIPTASR
jgi:hypothetical protein